MGDNVNDRDRLWAAFVKNKQPIKQETPTQKIETKAGNYFAIVTSLIAFVTSATALATFRQSDEVSVIMSAFPHFGFDRSSSVLLLKREIKLTFVNSGDRMAVIADLKMRVTGDGDMVGDCSDYGQADSIWFEKEIIDDPIVLKPGEIVVKSADTQMSRGIGLLGDKKLPPNMLLCMSMSIATPDSYAIQTLHIAGFSFGDRRYNDDSKPITATVAPLQKRGPMVVYKRWGTALSWLHGKEEGNEFEDEMGWRDEKRILYRDWF